MSDDKSALEDAEARLKAAKSRLVEEHLATAAVRHELAPLAREVDVLRDKLSPASDDEKKDEES